MKLKDPTQAQTNPHSIIEDSKAWVNFEYGAIRGSKHQLLDYAKRYKLMSAIIQDPNVTLTIAEAMVYLLEIPYES